MYTYQKRVNKIGDIRAQARHSRARPCTCPREGGKRPADSLARRATSRSIESRDGDVTPESYSNKYPSFDSRRFFSFAFPPPPSSTHARGHRRDSDATEQPGSAPTLELEIQLFEVLLKIQNERYSGRIDESGAVITDVNVSHAADRLDDGLEDVHSGTAASQTAVVQFSTHNKLNQDVRYRAHHYDQPYSRTRFLNFSGTAASTRCRKSPEMIPREKQGTTEESDQTAHQRTLAYIDRSDQERKGDLRLLSSLADKHTHRGPRAKPCRDEGEPSSYGSRNAPMRERLGQQIPDSSNNELRFA
ncbi:unnamed protein product [Trichogramma brassicae]|uniref:Uncharacterized protein n=1 Tax=Trichogramma brassicae TaxID=86971 RepID=A0A6H5I8F7_9HYME|nr:unnamed protein product [Trichogramma brassicae]